MSIRRSQFKMADKSAAMGIWLGKQVLGQRDIDQEAAQLQARKLDQIIEGWYRMGLCGKCAAEVLPILEGALDQIRATKITAMGINFSSGADCRRKERVIE